MTAEASSGRLLLVGPAATAMADRLEASGYATLTWDRPAAAAAVASGGLPADLLAIVLSAAAIDLAAPLRSLADQEPGGGLSLLLEVEDDSIAARSLCLEAGASDFWLRSAPPSDLLRRLRLHRRGSAGATAPPRLLEEGDLRLDPVQQRVWRGRREVQLTAREYALLLLLLEHRGQTVSRDEILSQVWGQTEEAGGGNVIEVYIRYLRLKLEADGERRLIHTVRGRGYGLRHTPF